ncbi:acyl carrier protein [Aquimarina sp. EL_43]|jgi:acyl carrier protein|uniref:Acyl carrier protein n=1 Tax=Aquimarina atlantica TaxID=1317122 RepID=A0A023BUE7_9FLAO|nr:MULTISPECIES: phosphopantetheine-binding protein [Aquimarina]EZH73626.1 acyl carrier protein [Aquimarina atlantica]MBG6130136.1 acyl carrier protein [Aquimarina sp. EL_35]MBG6148916.1 acyl carrier protein [Aquimarina sp. EL_32]MBG6168710.1 acyl carrier protein [Aquimarina sp. EL_43]PKV52952.1 acyl carrier protein [Aquimarina sp. MAR_2010_214]
MDKEVIIEKINDFLIDEFEVEGENISPEANLKETLELDSLDFVDLVVAVESNFGVKLIGEDFINVVTLQNFYDLIENKIKSL